MRSLSTSESLYVIGNGFDLHHKIASSYKAFGEYLKANDADTFEFVERYFDTSNNFWYEFEERLASLDSETLVEDASDFLVGYGADEWSDSYHHDYQYEISRAVVAISSTLTLRFEAWVRSLEIPKLSVIDDTRLKLDHSARFLNFNYTRSLQDLYGIPDDNILHIHGAASDPNRKLVLGHGWERPESLDAWRNVIDPESVDIRTVEGQKIIDRYFQETFKPTARIIRENSCFFGGLAKIKNVLVLGHSLAEVDRAYFGEIIRNSDPDIVRWTISYFDDIDGVSENARCLGLASNKVKFVRLEELR